MSTVRNNAQHSVSLTGGKAMSPGEILSGVDTSGAWEQILIFEGVLTLILGNNPPANPYVKSPVIGAGLSRVFFTGNSYCEGGTVELGSTNSQTMDRASRFATVACDILGCEETNFAHDGSMLYQHSDTAGWRASLKRFKPYKADGFTPHIPGEAGAWTGATAGEVAVLCRNMNDQLALGANDQDMFIEALRSECCRMRTTCWYAIGETGHGGWTYGAGVSASDTPDAGLTDGPYRILGVGATNWAQRTMPAHFPGGMMHVCMAHGSSGVVGGQFKIEVDGVVVAQTAFPAKYSALATYCFPTTTRFYCPPGARVIKITGTGGNGAGITNVFFGMGVESNDPPLVVLCAGHPVNDLAITTYGANASRLITEAQNFLQKQLAAEFTDGAVKVWEMGKAADYTKNPEYFTASEGLHPSEAGHLAMGADLAALIAANLPAKRKRRNDNLNWLNITDAWYTGAVMTAGVAVYLPTIFGHLRFRRELGGTIRLAGLAQIAADPGANTAKSLFTLPQFARPGYNEAFMCHGTTDGTTKSQWQVNVLATGVVEAQPPATGGKVPFGGTSYLSLNNISFKAAK